MATVTENLHQWREKYLQCVFHLSKRFGETQRYKTAFNLAVHILAIKLHLVLLVGTIESIRIFIFSPFAATEKQPPSDPEKDAINYNCMSQFTEPILGGSWNDV